MSRAERWGGALCALVMTAGLVACSGGEAPVPGHCPHAEALERPDTPGSTLVFRYDPGDVVEYFDSAAGNFRIHFTRNGDNAVPPTDVDTSGIPDFVEGVAAGYEEVLAHYLGLGYRAPLSDENIADNGGDGRFDVYLLDFGGTGDGNFAKDECEVANPEQCAGFITQENDFEGYGYPSTLVGIQTLSSHEFFHAVQAAYDTEQGSVLAEGTATWATENTYPQLDDFTWQVRGYLDNPDRSLDQPMPGPTDPFSYGTAIFFRFLEERFDVSLIRILWERSENGAGGVADPVWFEELDSILTEETSMGFADVFEEFATWNLYTGTFANAARAYADAAEWESVEMRDVLAPEQLDQLGVHYSSTRYYRVDPDDRSELRAALVVPVGEEAELDGLRMVLAAEGDAGYTEVVHVADPTAGTETVSLDYANYMVVAVVNVLQSGDAKQPSMCVGTLGEVQACRASILGQGGTGAAGGTGGMGGAGGAGGGPGPEATPSDDEGGCGCRLGARKRPVGLGPSSWWLLGGLAMLLGRRRRS